MLRTRLFTSRYYSERSFRVDSLENDRYSKLIIAVYIT